MSGLFFDRMRPHHSAATKHDTPLIHFWRSDFKKTRITPTGVSNLFC
jgi:hypothetical protein